MAKIVIKSEILEMMLYIWDSVHQKEKIADSFFIGLSDQTDMKYLYDEDFTKESVRKVLSAISNRELLNKPTKKESRYWNKHMWMLEDLEFTNMMIAPVKQLNLDDMEDKLSKEEYEVIFIPGHMDEYYIDENKLIINFFNITVDLFGEGPVTIAGKPFKEYIEEKLLSM
ncbi:hypothetical protein GCM10008904_31840 [Paraclostridium ghonii]|uniref:Transcription initiation factor IIE alpha subunit n=1 Tax=Paraclostridium ghonii TaxID=29358 RepID=A0ABU0MY24_9FIRM|nr:hypothetical protein [Paeniclostridium ghonii]MDQ0555411.1 transcription initiation factor IIE alpha subunit [Paeniclostridium ghonii]